MKETDKKFNGCIYFTANSLARKTEKLAQESWNKVGLSPSHAYLLLLVLETPGIQPGDIAYQLQLQPSTITRLIQKLETKKLIIRIIEGKSTSVYPTIKGKELVPKLKECRDEFEASYLAILGKEECAKLVSSMSRIAEKLQP